MKEKLDGAINRLLDELNKKQTAGDSGTLAGSLNVLMSLRLGLYGPIPDMSGDEDKKRPPNRMN